MSRTTTALDNLLATDPNKAIAAVRDAGAVTPDTARDLRDFGLTADGPLRRFILNGRLRESTGGRYYVFDPPPRSTRERLIKLAVIYGLIILIPIVEFWLAGRRR